MATRDHTVDGAEITPHARTLTPCAGRGLCGGGGGGVRQAGLDAGSRGGLAGSAVNAQTRGRGQDDPSWDREPGANLPSHHRPQHKFETSVARRPEKNRKCRGQQEIVLPRHSTPHGRNPPGSCRYGNDRALTPAAVSQPGTRLRGDSVRPCGQRPIRSAARLRAASGEGARGAAPHATKRARSGCERPQTLGRPRRASCDVCILGKVPTGAGDEIRTHDPYLGKVMLYP